MDEDIRLELKEVGKHIRGLGNQVASVNCNLLGLEEIKKGLRTAAKTVDFYIRLQKQRDKEVRP